MKLLSLQSDGSFLEIDVIIPAGDKNFTFYQGVPSTEWIILHNLGKFPNVVVIDSTNSEVDCEIIHDSVMQCRVLAANGFSGKASLN